MSSAIGLLYSALGQRRCRAWRDVCQRPRSVSCRDEPDDALFCGSGGHADRVVVLWRPYGDLGLRAPRRRDAELVTGLVGVGILANTSSLLGAGLVASGRTGRSWWRR